MSRLDEIQARLDAATPGPWWGGGSNRRKDSIALVGRRSDRGTGNAIAVLNGVGMDRVADAEFIAHAREDMPALVEFARRVEAVLDDHVSTNEQVFDELDRAMKRLQGGSS